MRKLSGVLASAAVAASLVAFSPSDAQAQTCGTIASSSLDLIDSNTWTGHGAPFFTASIRSAFEYSSLQIASLWGSSNPSSPLYYDHIINQNHFTHITTIEDADADLLADNIGAGDLLTIDAVTGYNGHSVVILSAPERLQGTMNPIIANTTQWAVEVADSTSTGHGCSSVFPDSRGCASGFVAGVGTGYMRLYTDNATGNLLGYTWSVTSCSTCYYAPATRPYAIGRVTPCPPL